MIYLKETGINIMAIDATFWVAISFIIFFGALIYLKIPQKISEVLDKMISDIKNEIDESEKLRTEAKTLLDHSQKKLDTAQSVSNEILENAKKDADRLIIEMNDKFHKMSDIKKNLAKSVSYKEKTSYKDIKKFVKNVIKNKNKTMKFIKKANKEIIKNLDTTIKNLLKKAEKNIETIMPGFTHLKNAQPVSFAHYMMAYVEMFKRDKKRFNNNFENLNENPLGVAALSGTSFNIDRNYTTKKLGFKKPTDNSMDSVSDRDFAIDFLYASAVCAMHLSRLAEDFIIYNSDAFNLISFKDSMLTGSSIMPQKKNPDPAELIRGKVGMN